MWTGLPFFVSVHQEGYQLTFYSHSLPPPWSNHHLLPGLLQRSPHWSLSASCTSPIVCSPQGSHRDVVSTQVAFHSSSAHNLSLASTLHRIKDKGVAILPPWSLPLLCTKIPPLQPGLLAVPLTCLSDSCFRHLLFLLSRILSDTHMALSLTSFKTWLKFHLLREALLLKTILSDILMPLSCSMFSSLACTTF